MTKRSKHLRARGPSWAHLVDAIVVSEGDFEKLGSPTRRLRSRAFPAFGAVRIKPSAGVPDGCALFVGNYGEPIAFFKDVDGIKEPEKDEAPQC